jgi:hypothetical protein
MVRWPSRTTLSPLTRSHERVFILWGIADEPTWPAWNPSVASSWPAISRIVVARLDGPDATCTSAPPRRGRASGGRPGRRCRARGRSRGGRRPVLELVEPGEVAAEQVELVLLGADRALDAAQRVAGEEVLDPAGACSSSSPALANRLPRVVAWAGTLWAAAGHDRCRCARRPGRRAGPARDACGRGRARASADLELLDVLGEVAGGHALVDVLVAGEGAELLDAGLHVVRVTRSRAAIEARSTWSTTAS